MANEETVNGIITYLVENGYDSEDFANILGLSKGTTLIYRILTSQ